MTIPNGICVDLETTISSKIPDRVRPPGSKRYETRILEIGAVDWQTPTRTYQALVNPVPSHVPLRTTKQFFQYFQDTYQHPTRTIDFWSKVLVKRHSVNRHMFSIEESPGVWLARRVDHRAKDFVRWHNAPESGPMFLSEKDALSGLLRFTLEREKPLWLAHNGNSFDFKVLQGCAERHSVHMPEIAKVDTLHLFRKLLPGHKSYSQPILYKNIFKRDYNAHVAIDDAKALATLCRHIVRKTTLLKVEAVKSRPEPKKGNRNPMKLTFSRRTTTRIQKRATPAPQCLLRLRGIGPKTVGALAAVHIVRVSQLADQYKIGGNKWLKSILPYGARWKVISESIAAL